MTSDIERVLSHLSSHGDFTAPQISEALALTVGRVRVALVTLEEEGLVERRPAPDSTSQELETEASILWGVKRIDLPPFRPIVKNLFRRITRRST